METEGPRGAVVESAEPGPDGKTLRVCLAGFSPREISFAYLPPEYTGAFLCPGAVLGPEAEAALNHAAACLAAEKAALRLVARAEQYGAGLARKLERRGHGPDAVRTVLGRLLELGLVDDLRYAGLWLKSRVRRGKKGPRTLETALRAKGIDRETAAEALKAALTGEAEAGLLERCVRAGEKRPGRPGADIRFFLKREGFSAAAIEAFFGEKDT
ncbi:MAG: recombination regulator RecX [Treponema sp.]|jgi:regulatory protein|nr:recombination regulator RecX [Treponema sp.]